MDAQLTAQQQATAAAAAERARFAKQAEELNKQVVSLSKALEEADKANHEVSGRNLRLYTSLSC